MYLEASSFAGILIAAVEALIVARKLEEHAVREILLAACNASDRCAWRYALTCCRKVGIFDDHLHASAAVRNQCWHQCGQRVFKQASERPTLASGLAASAKSDINERSASARSYASDWMIDWLVRWLVSRETIELARAPHAP